MRIGLVAAAVVLLAVGCSDSKQAEGPYSTADVQWLARFAGWDDEYSRRFQPVSDTFRDVLGSRRSIAALEEAVAPLRDCADTLKKDVKRPESERLRRAYDLLLKTCADDRRFADALVSQARAQSEEDRQAGADSSQKGRRDFESALRTIDGGLRANRPLPVRAGQSPESRIEPRLSRAASVLTLKKVEVRCWSKSEWQPTLDEWDAYTGTTGDVAGFVNGTTRINIEPRACATLARFVYNGWRPKRQSDAFLDAADAVDLLAHESQHLFNAGGDEAETECHGLQDVRRLAVLLGASKPYAERLARDDWRFLYPARPREYRTPECGPNRLFDMQPETPDFP